MSYNADEFRDADNNENITFSYPEECDLHKWEPAKEVVTVNICVNAKKCFYQTEKR